MPYGKDGGRTIGEYRILNIQSRVSPLVRLGTPSGGDALRSTGVQETKIIHYYQRLKKNLSKFSEQNAEKTGRYAVSNNPKTSLPASLGALSVTQSSINSRF